MVSHDHYSNAPDQIHIKPGSNNPYDHSNFSTNSKFLTSHSRSSKSVTPDNDHSSKTIGNILYTSEILVPP